MLPKTSFPNHHSSIAITTEQFLNARSQTNHFSKDNHNLIIFSLLVLLTACNELIAPGENENFGKPFLCRFLRKHLNRLIKYFTYYQIKGIRAHPITITLTLQRLYNLRWLRTKDVILEIWSIKFVQDVKYSKFRFVLHIFKIWLIYCQVSFLKLIIWTAFLFSDKCTILITKNL